MKLQIDSNVEFELNGGERKAVVDARELAEFKRALFETKGTPGAKPEDPPTLDWGIIIPETTAYIKEKCKVDIVPSEAIGIFLNADKAWGTIEKNWRKPTEVSVTSPDISDPRFSD